jgi:hypothetical protein
VHRPAAADVLAVACVLSVVGYLPADGVVDEPCLPIVVGASPLLLASLQCGGNYTKSKLVLCVVLKR